MKKIFVLMVALLFAVPAFAFEPPEYMNFTATLDDDAAAVTGAGYLYGIVFVTDGSNALACDVYNALSATGTKLVPTLQMAASPRIQTLNFDPPIPYSLGVYVDVTVAGGGTIAYMVYYRKR
jgi:hypothetical protein